MDIGTISLHVGSGDTARAHMLITTGRPCLCVELGGSVCLLGDPQVVEDVLEHALAEVRRARFSDDILNGETPLAVAATDVLAEHLRPGDVVDFDWSGESDHSHVTVTEVICGGTADDPRVTVRYRAADDVLSLVLAASTPVRVVAGAESAVAS